jgi:hypothetical protein
MLGAPSERTNHPPRIRHYCVRVDQLRPKQPVHHLFFLPVHHASQKHGPGCSGHPRVSLCTSGKSESTKRKELGWTNYILIDLLRLNLPIYNPFLLPKHTANQKDDAGRLEYPPRNLLMSSVPGNAEHLPLQQRESRPRCQGWVSGVTTGCAGEEIKAGGQSLSSWLTFDVG